VDEDMSGENIAGLSIQDGLMTAAWTSRGRSGRMRLRKLGKATYEDGVTDRGLAEAVRKLWHACRMPTFTVCSCLHSRSLVLKHFSFEGLTEAEIQSALRLEAELVLRLPQEDIVTEWQVTRTGSSEHGPCTEGILVAVPRHEVDRHLRVLEMAGLYPVILDVGCMAAANLCLALRREHEEEQSICLINASASSADIVVLGHDGFIYPRTVFRQTGTWANRVEYLAESLVEAVRYCQYNLRQTPVERLLVTGSAARMTGFGEHLAGAVGLPLECWDPLVALPKGSIRLHGAGKKALNPGCALTTILGLVLRGNHNGYV
jgi:Tfp pilus assembly PilM family ATPase